MQILGCLLMLLFVGFFLVVGLGLSFVSAVLRLFGFGRSRTTLKDEIESPDDAPQQKKVFSDDEGEYVDFEEVRE